MIGSGVPLSVAEDWRQAVSLAATKPRTRRRAVSKPGKTNRTPEPRDPALAALMETQLHASITEVDRPALIDLLSALEVLPRGPACTEWLLTLPYRPAEEALAMYRTDPDPLAQLFHSPACRLARGRPRCAHEADYSASAAGLRRVCAEVLCDIIASGLGERIEQMLLAAASSELSGKLTLGCDVTVRRSCDGSHGAKAAWEKHNPGAVHNDSWDGTILCFGLVSTKLGTPVYPAARFPNPLEVFLRQSRTGRKGAQQLEDGTETSAERAALLGPRRPWKAGTLVVMPACVAHSKPVDIDPDPTTARWFCRATLRVAIEGRRDSTPAGHALRLALALLVAEHVWQDRDFAAAARAFDRNRRT